MLQRFPGRTLDELDQMDWPRFWRAMRAQDIMDAEQKRKDFLSGNAKTMTEAEGNIIAQNDELIRRHR